MSLTGTILSLPANALISPTAPVGATPGSFAVSPSGAAAYTIPIVVAPGVNGMQPNLALVYNSQGGNGLLGMGWALSGLSVVHRCGATIELDGFKGGVNYDANDRLCLDGERLMLIGGSEYRTEKESLQKVQASDTTHNPAWFTVASPDGTVREYSIPIEAAGNPAIRRLWALSTIRDKHNNTVTFSYDKSDVAANGDYRPISIRYAYNGSAENTVVFQYQARIDISPLYEGGSAMRTLRRLSNISSFANGTLVRAYYLSYDENGEVGQSRLTAVTECGMEISVCLAPTRFGWQDGGTGFNTENWPTQNAWATGNYNWTGDFNGDGRTDIATASGANVYVRLSTGTGFNTQVWLALYGWASGNYNWLGDFNGDGTTDIATANGANVYMRLSTGGGFSGQVWPTVNVWAQNDYNWVADFNGDGRADIATASGANVYVRISTGNGFSTQIWPTVNVWAQNDYNWVADFNGDGKADIATANGASVYLRLSTGTGFITQVWSTSNTWAAPKYNWVGDFNGDGKADIATADGGNVHLRLSTGTGFDTQVWPAYGVWAGSNYNWATDFNGDGKADIATADGANVYVRLSSGTGFETQTWNVQGVWSQNYNWAEDFTGDGKADIASADGGSVYVRGSLAPSPDLVASFSDGLGVATSVSYKALTDPTVYTKETNASYPVQDIQNATYVVSQSS